MPKIKIISQKDNRLSDQPWAGIVYEMQTGQKGITCFVNGVEGRLVIEENKYGGATVYHPGLDEPKTLSQGQYRHTTPENAGVLIIRHQLLAKT